MNKIFDLVLKEADRLTEKFCDEFPDLEYNEIREAVEQEYFYFIEAIDHRDVQKEIRSSLEVKDAHSGISD